MLRQPSAARAWMAGPPRRPGSRQQRTARASGAGMRFPPRAAPRGRPPRRGWRPAPAAWPGRQGRRRQAVWARLPVAPPARNPSCPAQLAVRSRVRCAPWPPLAWAALQQQAGRCCRQRRGWARRCLQGHQPMAAHLRPSCPHHSSACNDGAGGTAVWRRRPLRGTGDSARWEHGMCWAQHDHPAALHDAQPAMLRLSSPHL